MITFDVTVKTSATCYKTNQTSELDNAASIRYSDGTNTISDTTPGNDQTPQRIVTLTGGPSTPCPPATPIPAIKVKKELISPVTAPSPSPVPAQPWGPFTYRITVINNTNPAVTLTGLQIQDDLNGAGTPPFTANFAASSVNPTCVPACIGTPPATNTPLVGSWPVLFKAQFAPLAPGNTQTLDYKVTYDTPCAEVTTGGTITNRAILSGGATGFDAVDVPMASLPLCDLQVTKTQTAGLTSFASYSPSPTLTYHVQFKNNSNQSIKVDSVVDAMSIDSATYGDVPVAYSYTCSASNVTPAPTPLTKASTSILVPYKALAWQGIRVIDFPGAVFGPNGAIDCDVTATLEQPSAKDALCQGPGTPVPNFINEAFMDLLPSTYSNLGAYPTYYPVWHKDVKTQLPYCVSIHVVKTAPENVYPGAAVIFTLTATNDGKDPISNVIMTDTVPAGFTNVQSSCVPPNACTAANVNGSLVSVHLSPNLAPGATVTIQVTANAPTTTGNYCNKDVRATIDPFPPNTYFEGDQAALTTAQACVKVVKNPDETSPTPTPTPSPAPGCAQVTDKDIRCLADGSYTYSFDVKNNSGKPMSQVLLTPVTGSAFSLSPQLTTLSSPLPDGQSTTITTNLDGVKAGDKPCIFVTLMADDVPCCTGKVCPTLPTCGGSPTPSPSPTATPKAGDGSKRPAIPNARPPKRTNRRP